MVLTRCPPGSASSANGTWGSSPGPCADAGSAARPLPGRCLETSSVGDHLVPGHPAPSSRCSASQEVSPEICYKSQRKPRALRAAAKGTMLSAFFIAVECSCHSPPSSPPLQTNRTELRQPCLPLLPVPPSLASPSSLPPPQHAAPGLGTALQWRPPCAEQSPGALGHVTTSQCTRDKNVPVCGSMASHITRTQVLGGFK